MLQLYSIVFFIFSLTFISFINGRNIAQKIFTPLGLFNLFHSFIFYLMPFLQDFFGVARFPELFFNDNIEIYISISIAMFYQIVVNVVVLFLGRTSFSQEKFYFSARNTTSKTKLAAIFCTLLILIGTFVMARLVSEYMNNFSYFMFNRINLLSGYGYFSKMLVFSLPLGVILLCMDFKKQIALKYFLLILLFIVIFFISLLIGSRAQALFLVPYLFMTWLFTRERQISNGILLNASSFIVVLLLLASVLSSLRNDVKNSDLLSFESNSYSESKVGKNLVEELKNSFSHAELFAFLLSNEQAYQAASGQTYWAGFVSFVPRNLWPDKPLGGGPMLANIVKPGAYILGEKEGNSSLTTGTIIESFLNFSYAGIFLFALLHGYLLSKITYFANNVRDPLDIAIFLLVTNFLSMTIVNAEFLGAFSAFLFTVLPLYFIKKVRL